ncbi:MAG: hypothetical protein IH987_04385 [Planctomycetes bacterium]|nr:hypothetical protein [Planctomycetota bacterium]
MSQLDSQIRRVQRRLWLSRWMHAFFFCLSILAGLFAAFVLVQRLYDLAWPVMWSGVGLGIAALLGSLLWMWVTREDIHVAATALDQAAGLRERLSSAQYCLDRDDPFARAVVADAEQVSGALSVRNHIRLRFPQPLPWASFSIVAAALMFLVTPGVLKPAEAGEKVDESELAKQTKAVVKKKLQEIQKLAEENPALADLSDDLRDLDKQAGGILKPGDIRHEAVKKIDRLADAVKKKQGDLKYRANQEMRRMFRRLQAPKSGSDATQKLAKKLQQGDFKSAKEEIAKLQEQLATLKSDADKELVAKIGKDLAKLAKQLEQLSIEKKLAQKLAQAGVKKEDLERMLQTLGKKDLEQIKKALEKQGLNQKQISKMLQKLQQQQQGAAQAQQLAKGMQKAAVACKSGQPGDAAVGLAQAAGQLSAAEALEAEMAQIEATLAELNSARNSLDSGCSQCNGTGKRGGKPCSACRGSGKRPGSRGGMGGLGKGKGGLAPEQQAGMGFKTERAKVHTGKGAIIGQFLVDGEQVKGDVQSTLSEVVATSEHDASDRIGRNRIPRQYQKAVKDYFINVRRLVKDPKASKQDSDSANSDPEGDE